jgi:hypothetical protein
MTPRLTEALAVAAFHTAQVALVVVRQLRVVLDADNLFARIVRERDGAFSWLHGDALWLGAGRQHCLDAEHACVATLPAQRNQMGSEVHESHHFLRNGDTSDCRIVAVA